MISLKKINFQIDNKFILQNLNLEIPRDKTTIIMGKNGAGKSTLLKLLNRIVQPTSGIFKSELTSSLPMLFQNPLILKNTVLNNYQILQKIKRHQPNDTWFKKYNLNKIQHQKISSISGGEKQKLFLARLMSFDQKYLFLDEPNQSLDLQSEKLLLQLLLEQKQNKTIIMTMHDFEFAKNIADLILYLENGKILYLEENKNFFKKFRH